MKLIQTSNPRFTILVDHYPYTETKQKLKTELQSWFDFKKQRNINISNYDLESDHGQSLKTSLEYRLNDGNFSFLYLDDQCLCFAGLQIRNKSAWIHRLYTNPWQYLNNLGTISQYLVPFQILTAVEKNCEWYKLTYTGRNTRFYYFYKDRKWAKSSFYSKETISGVERLSEFEFVGEQTINQTSQLVAQLNLNRVDISRFCMF